MTMQAQFAIPASQAKKIHDALIDCMSNDVFRTYLQGAALQNGLSLGLIAVATDGHKLGCLKITPEKADIQALSDDLNIILPRQAVEWLGKLKLSKRDESFMMIIIDEKTVTLKHLGEAEASFPLIEGNFPDWKRAGDYNYVDNNRPTVCLNADYIMQLAKAIKKQTDNDKRVKIYIKSADGPCYFTGNDSARYFLMPMRNNEKE